MRDGFIKVAAGTPKIKVGDCHHNAEAIFTLMREAAEQGVRVLVLPELCLTGATCGDLFFQNTLLAGAEEGLATVLAATRNLDMVTVVGLPLRDKFTGALYNCAVLVSRGSVLGVVPATHLTRAQQRWFFPLPDGERTVTLCGGSHTVSTRGVFQCSSLPELVIGVELGEAPFAPVSPSVSLAVDSGATLILCPAADGEYAARAQYRHAMISTLSARLVCGYVYANAGEGESTTDLVFAGHAMIAEKGRMLAERRFASSLTVSEIDVSRLAAERRRAGFPAPSADGESRWVRSFPMEARDTLLTRPVSPSPFLPEDPALRAARCDEILKLAALGLKKRLEHTRARTAVVGLSGGLDSTLAVLITALAMKLLGRPSTDILAITMPCFGTTDRTRDNAVELAERLGCTLRRIDIGEAVSVHFRDIGQPMDKHDVTFENAQARERTQVLMDVANQEGGMVIGTGDLSELALGWATYNGDHMSMYSVNAAIPKTLVRHLVSHVCADSVQEDEALATVLADILDTPVSPELLPAVGGKIAQKTEDLVGPYELHDFYLYYALRWGFSPRKVLRLAEHAFGRRYDRATHLKWLRNFYRRFFAQQFKRSCLPDGPKVGSVTFSPRGDWQMPSDAVAALWLDELEASEPS